mmetsp:Transcript_18242/g.52167  ORF Transcript_18242/g.52167 Transcript_18242/m.52167 type:complete len:254 (+) Transcript_18242:869-1630(+)
MALPPSSSVRGIPSMSSYDLSFSTWAGLVGLLLLEVPGSRATSPLFLSLTTASDAETRTSIVSAPAPPVATPSTAPPVQPSSCRHASSYVSNCATSQTSQTYTLMMVGLVFWTSVAAAAAEGPIVLWSLGGAATAGGAGAGAATATAGNGSGGMGGADDADDSTASATCCAAAASDAAATDSSPPSGGGGGGPWLPGLLPLDPAGPDATAAAAPAADPKTATDGTETDAGWDGAAAGAVGTGPALLAAPAAAD